MTDHIAHAEGAARSLEQTNEAGAQEPVRGPAVWAPSFDDAALEERCAIIATRLRVGLPVLDTEFDSLYGIAYRTISGTFWTPSAVARRVATRLVQKPGMRILDIGAGVGKFCLVGALSTDGVFVGVEHRPHLVEVARAVGERLGARRAQFHTTTFETLDPASFDAVYMFNPFEENRWGGMVGIDATVELTKARYVRDVRAAKRFLTAMRPGSRLATYYGFGGAVPRTFRLLECERFGAGNLDLWEQTSKEQARSLRAVK